jgi:succinate-semialdehyde dehydrogenase/glutarate-semialdehyde dehydrogenase
MATQIEIAARSIVSRNPATGEALGTLPCAGDADVDEAVARAVAAQPKWAALDVHERAACLRRFQRLLVQRKAAVARAITLEAGKPYAESLTTEILVVLDAARFSVETAYRLLQPQPVPHGNPVVKAKSGWLVREPYGVIGIIAPWNYPFSTPASETLAALITGNAVVLKPSEMTSLVALQLAELLHEAGVPRDIFQVVVGDGATGAALVNARVNKIIFTGSVATGRRIAQAAAARLLPVVLELGGKDAMIVLADADVDVASSGAVWGAFMNAGQTCLSVERCYVHRSLYDRFLAACVEKTKALRVGNGLHPDTDVGPMIHERQLRIVEEHVEEARRQGAQILCGGNRLRELGPNFYAPTVLAGVTPQMRILREETFGPVLPVVPFDSEDEAIRLANDSEYGLAASIWTRDRSRGQVLARHIQAGTVMINDVLTCFGISEAPHGGVKNSGLGRTHGRLGMEEMVWPKYVDSDGLPGMKKLWWYGYGGRFAGQMEAFVDMLFARSLWARISGALRSAGALVRRRR